MVGEYNAALDEIEYLLSIPALLSVPWLRVDPLFDPLRSNARFQRIVSETTAAGSPSHPINGRSSEPPPTITPIVRSSGARPGLGRRGATALLIPRQHVPPPLFRTSRSQT